jgi:hypothetical protein
MSQRTTDERIKKAWEIYQEEIRKGTPEKKAERRAVRKVFPDDANYLKTLQRWKDKGLWSVKEPAEAQNDTTDTLQDTTPENTTRAVRDTTSALPPDVIGDLLELVGWWRDRKKGEKMPEEMNYRPDFQGARQNSSVRINIALREAALKKAHLEHRNQTGDNISGLIEWLMWNYLDGDQRFLEREEPKGKPARPDIDRA